MSSKHKDFSAGDAKLRRIIAVLLAACLVKKHWLQASQQFAFDRAGYKYHGRVKALADGAREAGLEF